VIGRGGAEAGLRSDKVARRLLQRRLIDARQFDDAVRSQSFFGGELESHLLKLGHVSEADLGVALAEFYDTPYASIEQLRSVSEEAKNSLSREIVERFSVCPFEIAGNTLRVAMLHPRDRTALAAMEREARWVIEPWVTCEFRMYTALERHWRIRPGGVRAIALAPPDPTRISPDRREPGKDEIPGPGNHEESVGLDGLPLDHDAPSGWTDAHGDWTRSRAARSWLAGEEGNEFTSPAPPTASRATSHEPDGPSHGPRTMPELGAALAEAGTRDEIARATLGYAVSRAARAALFAVSRDEIRGIAGIGRGFDGIRQVSLPAASGTVFDLAGRAGESYVGPVPPLPANRDLFVALGGRLPVQAMIVPVAVKGRLAAFLYLDGDDGPIPKPDLPALRRVAAMTGLALELVLLRAKLREG